MEGVTAPEVATFLMGPFFSLYTEAHPFHPLFPAFYHLERAIHHVFWRISSFPFDRSEVVPFFHQGTGVFVSSYFLSLIPQDLSPPVDDEIKFSPGPPLGGAVPSPEEFLS